MDTDRGTTPERQKRIAGPIGARGHLLSSCILAMTWTSTMSAGLSILDWSQTTGLDLESGCDSVDDVFRRRRGESPVEGRGEHVAGEPSGSGGGREKSE